MIKSHRITAWSRRFEAGSWRSSTKIIAGFFLLQLMIAVAVFALRVQDGDYQGCIGPAFTAGAMLGGLCMLSMVYLPLHMIEIERRNHRTQSTIKDQHIVQLIEQLSAREVADSKRD